MRTQDIEETNALIAEGVLIFVFGKDALK